jgi:hypothetical protein
MQVMAFTSQAACQAFFTLRRVVSVAARRSMADKFARAPSSQSMRSDMPTLRGQFESRPAWLTAAAAATASGRSSGFGRSIRTGSLGIAFFRRSAAIVEHI